MGIMVGLPSPSGSEKDLQLNFGKNMTVQVEMRAPYLPAEWHTQSGIQLTWPHAGTDWAYMLEEVQQCFINIAQEIAKRELLLIVTPELEKVKQQIAATVNMNNVRFLQAVEAGALNGQYVNRLDFILEGGSIESDGMGTLLTTSECLLSSNRNERLNQVEIEDYLKSVFHLQQVLWLDHGYLAGDDTDSHIDTLARFCSTDTIAYVKCEDKEDEHYGALHAMEEQLKTFRTLAGAPYRLLALPMADKIEEDGERLPATYANFLILNDAILYPTYNQPQNDKKAGEVLQQAFPGRQIVGIDCRALIKQHGSLHCVTMQYPTGVIK